MTTISSSLGDKSKLWQLQLILDLKFNLSEASFAINIIDLISYVCLNSNLSRTDFIAAEKLSDLPIILDTSSRFSPFVNSNICQVEYVVIHIGDDTVNL